MALYRWGSFSFTLVLALDCLSNLCDYLVIRSYSWYSPDVGRVPRPVSVPKGGNSLSTYFRLIGSQALSSFYSLQICTVWGCNSYNCWPPDHENWRWPLGEHCQNWDSKWVFKLISGKSSWAVARPKGFARIVLSPLFYSLGAPPWPLGM